MVVDCFFTHCSLLVVLFVLFVFSTCWLVIFFFSISRSVYSRGLWFGVPFRFVFLSSPSFRILPFIRFFRSPGLFNSRTLELSNSPCLRPPVSYRLFLRFRVSVRCFSGFYCFPCGFLLFFFPSFSAFSRCHGHPVPSLCHLPGRSETFRACKVRAGGSRDSRGHRSVAANLRGGEKVEGNPRGPENRISRVFRKIGFPEWFRKSRATLVVRKIGSPSGRKHRISRVVQRIGFPENAN